MIQVFDDFLSEELFEDYMKRLKFAKFDDVESQGLIYKDISLNLPSEKLYENLEKKLEFKPDNVLNFTRAYRDRRPPHDMWIHSDVLFADYIAIFMAQPSDAPQDDGVAFWYNKELDDIQLYTKDHTGEKNKVVDSQTLDPEKWILRTRVEFKENRMVVAPAAYFHSKASYGNRGRSLEDCRIVHVLFFNEGSESE